MSKIQRALISVTDKSGLEAFAKGLVQLSVEIISTGGTARFLRDAGIKVRDVSELTDFPEIMDGRVKTLHPKIAGGILGIRTNPTHQEQAAEHNIALIDLVVVNLYAFEETVARPDVSLAEAIENIDIGGPTLIRAAAKNHAFAAVVTDPADYPALLDEMSSHQGAITDRTRQRLALKAFALTARYDGAITRYLEGTVGAEQTVFPSSLTLSYCKQQELRYGENPHQRAAVYRDWNPEPASLSNAEQLHGKELSYNNFLDLDAALGIAKEFSEPACVIIKHNNPAGAAVADHDLREAFEKALECDPVSAFGGIIGLNRIVDKSTAEKIHEAFYEAVLAPDYEPSALALLRKKKNIRLLRLPTLNEPWDESSWMIRSLTGGVLVQDRDHETLDIRKCRVPSKRAPTESEWRALDFSWKIARHVKSNAIIFCREDRTIGVGAGQMSRIDATKIAAMKCRQEIKGAVMASDAFFPFRDNVDEAAKLGISAIISPGGSIRDEEVIQAADEHDLALVFTGIRHFRH